MTTNLNTNPYYDDFDHFKNYHQILFRPSYAVQARELTQIQSILKNQIEQFGSHIFKQGSVVIPGNSFADLNVPYIKLEAVYNSENVPTNLFIDQIIVGATSGVRAIVKNIIAPTGADPLTFYLAYLSGGVDGTTPNGKTIFDEGEEIYVINNTTIRATVQTGAGTTGVGAIAYVNTGVFYVNGTFVSIEGQSTVISKYTNTPSARVLLKINEEIVDANIDETLFDPAQGYNNFAAPGADRLKISLELMSLPLTTEITDDYVELMRYEEGNLLEHARYPKYNELEKSLARRTYDESGSYLVNGFGSTVIESLKTPYNDGLRLDGDRDKFAVSVAPGKAYVEGLEQETFSRTIIEVDKARTDAHVGTQRITSKAEYGTYIYIADLVSLPNMSTFQVVDLYTDNDRGNLSAVKIGTARAVAVDYEAGDPIGTDTVYRFYITDLKIDAGYAIDDVGGVRFDTVGAASVLVKYTVPNATLDFVVGSTVSNAGATRTATVKRYLRSTSELFVYRHDHTKEVPKTGELITGSSGGSPSATITGSQFGNGLPKPTIIKLRDLFLKSIKNQTTNLYDIQYTTWAHATITIGVGGTGSFTVTDGTVRNPEVGTMVASSNLGRVNLSRISVSGGNVIDVTGTSGEVVGIIFQVDKVARQPKVKTLADNTASPLVVAPATSISLGVADVVRILSITQNGADVSGSFVLDNGQTDYYYGISKLTQTRQLNSSDDLTITFEYFQHSGTGDYFSIDSYSGLGTDYVARVPSYRSRSSSELFDLAKCIDFRPTMGSDNTFTGVGSSLVEYPVSDTFVSTSIQYYMPRIDTVLIDKDGKISVKTGVPSLRPSIPTMPTGGVGITSLVVPAYTVSSSDIFISDMGNFRYTMSDIKKLDRRIETLEYFSTLTSLESAALSREIVDQATGIARFKTGYLADNFDNVFSVCDFPNRENRLTMTNGDLSSDAYDHEAVIEIDSVASLNYQITGAPGNGYDIAAGDRVARLGGTATEFEYSNGQTVYIDNGGFLTLPYTETPFIEQKVSTRITNLNPFLVFEWEGILTIEPSFDNWIERKDLETIFTTAQETVQIVRQSPPAPVWESWAPETVEVQVLARDVGLASNDPNDPNFDLRLNLTVDAGFSDLIAIANGGNGLGGGNAWNEALVAEQFLLQNASNIQETRTRWP